MYCIFLVKTIYIIVKYATMVRPVLECCSLEAESWERGIVHLQPRDALYTREMTSQNAFLSDMQILRPYSIWYCRMQGLAGPGSSVGCAPAWYSDGHEFDLRVRQHSFVEADWSWNHFYGYFLLTLKRWRFASRREAFMLKPRFTSCNKSK